MGCKKATFGVRLYQFYGIEFDKNVLAMPQCCAGTSMAPSQLRAAGVLPPNGLTRLTGLTGLTCLPGKSP